MAISSSISNRPCKLLVIQIVVESPVVYTGDLKSPRNRRKNRCQCKWALTVTRIYKKVRQILFQVVSTSILLAMLTKHRLSSRNAKLKFKRLQHVWCFYFEIHCTTPCVERTHGPIQRSLMYLGVYTLRKVCDRFWVGLYTEESLKV